MKIKIESNPYDLELKDLILMANRVNNPKRNFLFVSKVLGKHIELEADLCKAMGFLLVSRLYGVKEDTKDYIKLLKGEKKDIKESFNNVYEKKEKTLIIGFAETATGLGMAVASAIKDSCYLTTTRENIIELKSILNFEEEHSHATTHKCFLKDKDKLLKAERIILVDDEITTGKSMLNIIKELKKLTLTKKFTILSILDWRNNEYKSLYEEFQEKENLDIDVLSLISGDIEVNDKKDFKDNNGEELKETIEVSELNIFNRINYKSIYGEKSYIKDSGRFSVDFTEIKELESLAEKAALAIEKKIGQANRTLVLGHGENIYIPSRVAAYLTGEVFFKSTTRSPIYCKDIEGYPIKEKHNFVFEDVRYYFYNKSFCEKEYDRVILLTEDNLNIKLTNNSFIFKL